MVEPKKKKKEIPCYLKNRRGLFYFVALVLQCSDCGELSLGERAVAVPVARGFSILVVE